VAEQQIPTWPEKNALQWLIGNGQLTAITAEQLVPLYRRRGYLEEGAKRAAGNVIGRLRRKGFLREAGDGHEVTRSGKRAAQ
jgi:hypothetical protein